MGPHLERNRNQVSSWHTGGIKTSKLGVNRRMRKQVKGEDTHGKPVGGGVGGERLGLVSGKTLMSTESTTKLKVFTLKGKENASLPQNVFSVECHVLPGPTGSEGANSAVYLANIKGIRNA